MRHTSHEIHNELYLCLCTHRITFFRQFKNHPFLTLGIQPTEMQNQDCKPVVHEATFSFLNL